VSSAALLCRMIPRENAWLVSGTPVRRDVDDLFGLLSFLRYEPYVSKKHIWASLISWHKRDFNKLFFSLSLRHSKRSVRDELRLPAQRRYVITMPFTPIEEQHYQELFNEMLDEVGLDADGVPIMDNWNPDLATETMRKWLVRLRQTALHPEVGGKNRRALGQKDGPLRTVDEVLEVMIFQADSAIHTDQRNFHLTRLKRGQLYEESPRVKEALKIWDSVVMDASKIVDECRKQLQEELKRESSIERSSGREIQAATSVESDDSDDEANG
jgi:E3 ubiquitin-protein ligase SHPRH